MPIITVTIMKIASNIRKQRALKHTFTMPGGGNLHKSSRAHADQSNYGKSMISQVPLVDHLQPFTTDFTYSDDVPVADFIDLSRQHGSDASHLLFSKGIKLGDVTNSSAIIPPATSLDDKNLAAGVTNF